MLGEIAGTQVSCKNWYPNSRTMSDDHVHRSTEDHRSVRTFAVKPRAFGAPLFGRWGLTARRGRAIRRPFRKCTFVMLVGIDVNRSSDNDR